MKFQNILRMQAIVMGFGAALLLANAVNAQEIDNTVWDESPNVADATQPAPALAANDTNSTVADSQAMSPAAMIATPIVTREDYIAQSTPAEGWMIVSLLVCIALVALYALAEAHRANRNLNARANQVYTKAALS